MRRSQGWPNACTCFNNCAPCSLWSCTKTDTHHIWRQFRKAGWSPEKGMDLCACACAGVHPAGKRLQVSSPYYLQIKLVRTALYMLLRPSLNFKLEAIFSLIRMITKLLLIREQVFLLTMNRNYHSLVHKRNSNNHPPLKQIQEQSKQFSMNTAHRDNFTGRFW